MAHLSLTQRLTFELRQLADEIRTLDEFNQETTLDIHALSCLMRYAAWSDPEALRAWLLEREFTRNPQIVDRVSLFCDLRGEGAERDGVEIRIHVFRDGNETFKHSHKQSFITVCLQGEYRYRYFEAVGEAVNSQESEETQRARYQVYRREGGRQRLLEERIGEVIEVRYDERGVATPHQGGTRFHEDEHPVFVDARWIHTVEHTSPEPVITFVARRGKWSAETEVWRAPGDHDPTLENDSPPRPMSSAERARVCDEVIEALLRHQPPRSGSRRWRDVARYLTPQHRQLYLGRGELSDAQRRLLHALMERSGVFSVPILDERGRCVDMVAAPVVDEPLDHQAWAPLDLIEAPLTVGLHDPLMYALLGMILNESLCVPVADDEGRCIGVLTLDDILERPETLGAPLLWSLYEHRRDDPEIMSFARGLLNALRDLWSVCYQRAAKPTRDEHDRLVHRALTYLDELIILIPESGVGWRERERAYTLDTPIAQLARYPLLTLDADHVERDQDLTALLGALSDRGEPMIALVGGSHPEQIERVSTQGREVLTALSGDTPLRALPRHLIDHSKGVQLPVAIRDAQGQLGILDVSDVARPEVIALYLDALRGVGDLSERDELTLSRCLNPRATEEERRACVQLIADPRCVARLAPR